MKVTKLFAAALVPAAIVASGCVVSTQPTPVASNSISWSTSLAGGSDPVGSQLSLVCPPNGSPSTVWGTDVYSDDSSVCTAAVHMGLITFAGGGVVRVVIQPGQASYLGSARNGVTTSAYGAWGRSYSFAP